MCYKAKNTRGTNAIRKLHAGKLNDRKQKANAIPAILANTRCQEIKNVWEGLNVMSEKLTLKFYNKIVLSKNHKWLKFKNPYFLKSPVCVPDGSITSKVLIFVYFKDVQL